MFRVFGSTAVSIHGMVRVGEGLVDAVGALDVVADAAAAALGFPAPCRVPLQPATTRLKATSAHVRPTTPHGGRDRSSEQSISPAAVHSQHQTRRSDPNCL